MQDDTRQALAELIGTFTLVFIGAGAGALGSMLESHVIPTGPGLLGVALAHGIALAVIVYAWGPISGAHVNPAVTFAVALTGNMPWLKAARYWLAQLLGAALAALVLRYLLGEGTGLGRTTGLFTFGLPAVQTKAIVIEAILTFFLVIAVFGSAVSGRNGNAYGLAIGLVLTMDILAAGPLTGASMNPARTFGPCLALSDYSYFWIYVVGPLIGAAVAGILFSKLYLPPKK
jgi:MIP family channel proteins